MRHFILFLFFMIIYHNVSANKYNLDYKKSQIILEYDKNFAKKCNWNELGISDSISMAIDKNGNIFILDSKYSCIYKFSNEGELLKKFGQRGEAPGELRSPGSISIIDDIILIDEYPLLKRISLFNTNGIFKGYLKTRYNVGSLNALNNCTVISTWNYGKNDKLNNYLEFYEETTNHLLKIVTYTSKKNIVKFKAGKNGTLSIKPSFRGETLKRGFGNKLLLCNSKNKIIKIYNNLGNIVDSFNINMNKLLVSKKIYIEYSNYVTENLRKKGFRGVGKRFLNALRKKLEMNFNYLPFFQDVVIDLNGNILVINFRTELNVSNKLNFQVYDSGGNYICSSAFVSNKLKDFNGYAWQQRQSLIFYNNNIFALLENIDNPEEPYYEVVKFDIHE